MANNRFHNALKREGYCCPYAFFWANNQLSAWELAELLQISERTAKTWRRRYRDKLIKCEFETEATHRVLCRKYAAFREPTNPPPHSPGGESPRGG